MKMVFSIEKSLVVSSVNPSGIGYRLRLISCWSTEMSGVVRSHTVSDMKTRCRIVCSRGWSEWNSRAPHRHTPLASRRHLRECSLKHRMRKVKQSGNKKVSIMHRLANPTPATEFAENRVR